jgi:hypothetical protein
MLSISQQQLDAMLVQEYRNVGQRISEKWPTLSTNLYPDHVPVSADIRKYWIGITTDACWKHKIGGEDAIIFLAISALSAATLNLPDAFICEMSAFFLACASGGANDELARKWINWILLEQRTLSAP